jgi:hypothetical protein
VQSEGPQDERIGNMKLELNTPAAIAISIVAISAAVGLVALFS